MASSVSELGKAAGLSAEIIQEARKLRAEVLGTGARFTTDADFQALDAGALFAACAKLRLGEEWSEICCQLAIPLETINKGVKKLFRNLVPGHILPTPKVSKILISKHNIVIELETPQLSVMLDGAGLTKLLRYPGDALATNDYSLAFAYYFEKRKSLKFEDVQVTTYVYSRGSQLGLPDEVGLAEICLEPMALEPCDCDFVPLSGASVARESGALGLREAKAVPVAVIRHQRALFFLSQHGAVFGIDKQKFYDIPAVRDYVHRIPLP